MAKINKNILEEIIDDIELAADEYGFNATQELDLIKELQKELDNALEVSIAPSNLEETEFCFNDYNEVSFLTRFVNENGLKIGDKVKLILVISET